jgi:two-component system, NtrC family, response regulator AtoC
MATRRAEPILVEESQVLRNGKSPAYLESVSSAMRPIEQALADIAPTEIPVLVIGESGTGKDVVAAQLHRNSLRRGHAFRKLLGSSVKPEMLLPAGMDRETGTLYLDEVADLPPAGQTCLLQLLEQESTGSIPPPRLICGSTRNLEDLMRTGRFREELYFRLNGVCLRLPPLRHRREDLPALAEFFLKKYAGLFHRQKPILTAQEMRALEEHNWPGNIRELENAMKNAVLLGGPVLQFTGAGDAAPAMPAVPREVEGISLKEAARAASRHTERELILKALTRTRWNRKRAAMDLQISYKALLYKLKQIGPEETAGD